MNEPSWIALLPTVLAIVLAVWSRQVYVSLAAGIWLGWTILEDWNPLAGIATAVEQTVAVLGDPGNAKVILFTLVIGAMIATLEAAGGVRGFVRWIEGNRWVTNGRRAQFLAWIIGIVIFIESNITVLVAGAVSRPLFDRFRISRERLAYIVDSTSAPICILIPLNAWGALNLGILNELGVEDALGVFVAAIPVNFYALIAFLLAGASILWKIDIGPMKRAESRTRDGRVLWPNAQPMVDETVLSPTPVGRIAPRARNMLVPIAVMVLTMPLGLYVTGGGSMLDGSGSTSVLWAVLAGLGAAWLMLLGQRGATLDELTRTGLKGAGGLMPLALILLLALALGSVARTLGAGRVRGAGDRGRAAARALPAARVPGRRRDRVFDRVQLGHLRHHAAHRGARGGDVGHAAGPLRGGGALRRHLRRPLLAHQRHHHHLVHGGRHRPHRSRAHAAALRADRRGSGGRLLRGAGGDALRRREAIPPGGVSCTFLGLFAPARVRQCALGAVPPS